MPRHFVTVAVTAPGWFCTYTPAMCRDVQRDLADIMAHIVFLQLVLVPYVVLLKQDCRDM